MNTTWTFQEIPQHYDCDNTLWHLQELSEDIYIQSNFELLLVSFRLDQFNKKMAALYHFAEWKQPKDDVHIIS